MRFRVSGFRFDRSARGMVYCLCSFPSTAIYACNFVTDTTVIVCLRELCRRAIRRAANLRSDFILFFRWPGMTQITDFDVETAKLLVNFQILNIR
jgi:hypothetical protein